MITPKYRFNLSKTLNKTMFGNEWVGNILAVVFIGNFHIKIKVFLTPIFYLLPDFRNIATKRIVLTCSKPLFIHISILKNKWSF